MKIALQTIDDYLRDQLVKFEKNYRTAIADYNGDAIHDLRVAIKRTRFVLTFLHENNLLNKHSAAYAENLERVFNPFGSLRDVQIKAHLLKTMKLFNLKQMAPVKAWLETKTTKSKEKIRETFKEFSFYEFEIFKTTSHLKKAATGKTLTPHKINRYLRKKLSEMRQLFAQPDLSSHLHEIRKRLKEIYYLLEMAKKTTYSLDGQVLDLATIKKIEDEIGNWHDHELLYKNVQRKLFKRQSPVTTSSTLLIKMEKLVQMKYDTAVEGLQSLLKT